MADNFVLVGDSTKRVDRLTNTYPLVVEVIPEPSRTCPTG